MLPLLCISSALFIPPAAPHVCPHVLPDTQPPNAGPYLHPTLQNMASTNHNQATVYKKIRRTARLFEMTFTSAPPHVLSAWPPVYLTNWFDWGGVLACMHACVCTWVGVHFASVISTNMCTVVVVAKENTQTCTENSLIDMWDVAGSATWLTLPHHHKKCINNVCRLEWYVLEQSHLHPLCFHRSTYKSLRSVNGTVSNTCQALPNYPVKLTN